jgi:hypothetical protein
MGSSSSTSGQVISGKATKVSTHSLSIQTDAGTRETLAVAPETIITVDGRDGRLSDITLGTDVRASYNELEGKKIAIKLDANRAGTGTGTSGSSTGTGTSTAPDTSGSSSGTGTSTAPDTSGSGSTGATQPGTETPSSGR